MQNLIIFLIRYSTLIVFVLLELISYLLVVTYNSEQSKIFHYSSNIISGTLQQKTEDLRNYIDLTSVADSLMSENAGLKAQLFAYKKEGLDKVKNQLVVDFDLISARVSNNSISSRHNSFTLNKGSNDGVESEMGVMNAEGVVGIIRYVSKHYSTAISILNPNMRISSKIKGSNYFGILRWTGMDLNRFDLIDIPKYAKISKGDTIITSSYSSIFPEELLLGTIDKIELQPGSNTFDIRVKILVHPEKMNYAYIIKNKNFKEIRSLEELMKEN